MEPKVSIIIPVYNVEPFLARCLDSVVGQTLRGIEIICVDDGSPDRSIDILNRYAAQDDRIRVISQENRGLGGARNRGFDAATGEFILFVDSDDWIDPAYCERLYEAAREAEADIACASMLKIRPSYSKWTIHYTERQVAAEAQEKFLYNDEAVEADPLLGNMRRNLLSENHLSQIDGFDTDLIRLAEQNPSNKAAFHYAGVFYLLAKDVTRFKTLVETYYGTDLLPSLPVSFQEAIIILSEKDPDYWKRFGVSESIVGRFTDYKRQVLAGRNNSNALPGLMYRSYGDTYWYYYMFK